jgi:hypothetical protein
MRLPVRVCRHSSSSAGREQFDAGLVDVFLDREQVLRGI